MPQRYLPSFSLSRLGYFENSRQGDILALNWSYLSQWRVTLENCLHAFRDRRRSRFLLGDVDSLKDLAKVVVVRGHCKGQEEREQGSRFV
jgi:hypothetical protein